MFQIEVEMPFGLKIQERKRKKGSVKNGI